MDPRERDMLRRALELSEESNEMLKSIRRGMRIGMFFKTIYWIVVLGIAVGAFYLIQPYVNGVTEMYQGIKENVNQADSLLDKAKSIL